MPRTGSISRDELLARAVALELLQLLKEAHEALTNHEARVDLRDWATAAAAVIAKAEGR
jgi:hypothetical protein